MVIQFLHVCVEHFDENEIDVFQQSTDYRIALLCSRPISGIFYGVCLHAQEYIEYIGWQATKEKLKKAVAKSSVQNRYTYGGM